MVLFIALILLYPVWIWPFGAAILERFFRKEIPPEMSQQERFQAGGWNAFITLVLGPPHPEMSEMNSKSIAHYQQTGRPDLARRVKDIGQILLWWKGVAFLAQFLFPIPDTHPDQTPGCSTRTNSRMVSKRRLHPVCRFVHSVTNLSNEKGIPVLHGCLSYHVDFKVRTRN